MNERRYYRQPAAGLGPRRAIGCALWVVPFLCFVAAVGADPEDAPGDIAMLPVALLAFLSMCVLMPLIIDGPGRRAVSVDDHGLAEHFWYRPARRTSWAQIVAVTVTSQGAQVQCANRTLYLSPPLEDWQQLAELAANRMPGCGEL